MEVPRGKKARRQAGTSKIEWPDAAMPEAGPAEGSPGRKGSGPARRSGRSAAAAEEAAAPSRSPSLTGRAPTGSKEASPAAPRPRRSSRASTADGSQESPKIPDVPSGPTVPAGGDGPSRKQADASDKGRQSGSQKRGRPAKRQKRGQAEATEGAVAEADGPSASADERLNSSGKGRQDRSKGLPDAAGEPRGGDTEAEVESPQRRSRSSSRTLARCALDRAIVGLASVFPLVLNLLFVTWAARCLPKFD